ncbi:hypothetical protein ABT160_05485 [Streptomyces sp. NPDC001941]|uniref:hypothetical protein n=1 Tax=Streptomyces sp. NPDC001941 TaxID=3154659 RepID=UPI00331FD956
MTDPLSDSTPDPVAQAEQILADPSAQAEHLLRADHRAAPADPVDDDLFALVDAVGLWGPMSGGTAPAPPRAPGPDS